MQRLAELPPSVRGYLCDFVRRWRRLIALHAIGTALAVLAIWMLCACAADRLLHFSGLIRVISLVLAAVVAIGAGMMRLGRLRGPVDWVAMAGVIEKHDSRFSQALITVTSRMLGSPEHRGSDEILSHLLRQVENQAAGGNASKLLSLRAVAGPWIVLAIALAMMIGLSRMNGLGGPQLLARFMSPLSDRPPVTTTKLVLLPAADTDVMQSEQLRIEVQARPAGNSPVSIFINDDGDDWTRYPMDDAGDGRFTYTLNAVGHDLRYYVTGGDATSRIYAVRVKRPPAVAEFQILYTYPPYTNKPPFTVTNTDGAIEAPAGSDALLTIVSTEPLQAALLTLGDQTQLMQKAGADNLRQLLIHVRSDASYALDLISTRDVHGGGAGKMVIHATADRPPVVKLLQAGRMLRLNPREVVPLSFAARDDYGIASVTMRVQVNANTAALIPVHLVGDRRRQDDTFDFDLSMLNCRVGDVVKIALAARDTSAQETTSEELRVLISPRSIDLDAQARIQEFAGACGLAASVADELDAALKAIEDTALRPGAKASPSLTAESLASRRLSNASESATLLRQTLVRAQTHSSSAALSVALADWSDLALQQAQTADDLFRRAGSLEGLANDGRDRLRRAVVQSREFYRQLRTAGEGELAQTVLADRDDLSAAQRVAAPPDAKTADELMLTLQHAREEIAANEGALGVSEATPDVEGQLRARVDAARALVHSRHPIDFAAAANDWAQRLAHDPHSATGLDARLATAAQAEAVRKDADLIRARDLELAARAMGAVDAAAAQSPTVKSTLLAQINTLAADMAALQREHLLSHQPANPKTADELRVARTAGNRARDDLTRWAGEGNSPKIAAGSSRPGDLESLALRVGADSARKEYKRTAEEDRQLAMRLNDSALKPAGRGIESEPMAAANPLTEDRVQRLARTAESVSRQMSWAESIDKLSQLQDRLLAEARAAKVAARDIAGRQRAVAEQIADFERRRFSWGSFPTEPTTEPQESDWRDLAMAALIFGNDRLTEVRVDLSVVQEADTARRKSADRAAAARREIATAPPDRLRAAHRAADEAEQEARTSVEQAERALTPLTPQVAIDLANRMEPFVPETSIARNILSESLAAALSSLCSACQEDDADAVADVIGELRGVITDAQKEMIRLQNTLIERNPMIAAKWLARAAADAIVRHPADLRQAQAYQASAAQALARAWDQSIHRAAELRLSQLPSFQSALGPAPLTPRDMTAAAAFSSHARPLAWPMPADTDDLAASFRDSDPPGYEDSLRLYFDALGKAQEKTK